MESPTSHRIGYAWLAERFGVVTLPYWRESRALVKGTRHLVEKDGRQIEYLPAARDPGDDVFAQLEFALKREGLHLELLRKVLPQLDGEEVARFVRSKPTGRYARVIWWCYEEFARTRLDLPDLEMGSYVDLLDEGLFRGFSGWDRGRSVRRDAVGGGAWDRISLHITRCCWV